MYSRMLFFVLALLVVVVQTLCRYTVATMWLTTLANLLLYIFSPHWQEYPGQWLESKCTPQYQSNCFCDVFVHAGSLFRVLQQLALIRRGEMEGKKRGWCFTASSGIIISLVQQAEVSSSLSCW